MTNQPQAPQQAQKSAPRRRNPVNPSGVPIRELRITGMHVADVYQACIAVSRIETELMRLSNNSNAQVIKGQLACRDTLTAVIRRFQSELQALEKDVGTVRRSADAIRRERNKGRQTPSQTQAQPAGAKQAPAQGEVAAPQAQPESSSIEAAPQH